MTDRYRITETGPEGEERSLGVGTLEDAIRAAIETLDVVALSTVPSRSSSAHLAGVGVEEWLKRHSPDSAAWDAYRDGCYRLSESGGTIGPLPDGTTIQVERITND